MSGPIVRKYGFPNFEQIFGKRELEHGAEEAETASVEPAKSEPPGGREVPKKSEPEKK